MESKDDLVIKRKRRLLIARNRILSTHGFFGLLLMHAKYSFDYHENTFATDGTTIYVDPKFLDKIDDEFLDFVLMHEILHMALSHIPRAGDRDNKRWNIACDTVVNSNIFLESPNLKCRFKDTSYYLTPNGEEGYKYTAEEVYNMLKSHKPKPKKENNKGTPSIPKPDGENDGGKIIDDHSKWKKALEDGEDSKIEEIHKWQERLFSAAKAATSYGGGGIGTQSLMAERIIKEFLRPKIDWRKELRNAIESIVVVDYTFLPPDRRLNDYDFFFPSFDEKNQDKPQKLLFAIDTSGSISEDMLTKAYSEVKGAIEQFDGYIDGYICFFDARMSEVKEFNTTDDLKKIPPLGGGGTDVTVVFDYLEKNRNDFKTLIVLTDGYTPYPKEEPKGLYVIWVISNNNLIKLDDGDNKNGPPFGKVILLDD